MSLATAAKPMSLSVKRQEALRSLRVSDICLVFYAIASIAFDDGSLISQLSRVAIVAGTFTELGKTRFRFTGYHAWLIVFAGIVFFSRYWAFSRTNAIDIFSTVLYNVVCLSCVAFLLYQDKRRIRLVLGCMVIAPLLLELRVVATGGLFAFLSGRTLGSISANTVGLFSAFGVYLAYAFCRESKNSAWLLLAALNLCVTLLSASRKAIMVIALVAILLVILDAEKRNVFGKAAKLLTVVIILAFASFLMLNIPFLYDLVGVRMEGLINGFLGTGTTVDASTQTRMRLVEYGLEWFGGNPIVGYGGDNFRALMAAYHPGGTAFYAHNNYVELLVSYGLIGAVSYYFLHVVLIARGFLHRRSLAFQDVTVFCLLIGLLIMDYGFVDYYSRGAQLFLVLAWAVLCKCNRDEEAEEISR